jgi:hypothetical protein
MKTLLWGFTILMLVAVMVAVSHGHAATPFILSPADDSFVRVGTPGTNFDEDVDEISVTTAMDATSDIGYLRFDVSSISDTDAITATLRLYEQTGFGSGVIVGVYSTASDDWNGDAAGNGDETTLTYNNAPTEVSPLASLSSPDSPAWMAFSSLALTDYVRSQLPSDGGDGLVTLMIRVANPGGLVQIANFEDRENGGGTGNCPELALDTSCVLSGDLDSDGDVDIDDVMEVASRWRTSCEIPNPDGDDDTPNYDPLYDIDDNCIINVVDIMLVVKHWGETCE